MGDVVNAVLSPITGSGGVQNAGAQAAAAMQQAGINAANIAAFNPIGMTTNFGTSNFTTGINPVTGVQQITGASYTPAPALQGIQNQLFGQFAPTLQQAQQMAGQYAPLTPAAQSLFNLGQQYLATSPEEAAQNYITNQQALLSPSRQAQLSNVRNRLFATGRGGLGVQTGTGGAPASPELQAYYNALAQQDLQLAANAQQAGQQQTMFGAGLFGTGAGLLGAQTTGQAGVYAPLQAQLGLSGQVEQMAMQPYQLGLQLGQAQVPGQTAGAQSFFGGQMGAAQMQYGSQLAAQQMNNQFLSSLIGAGAGGFAGGGGGGFTNPFNSYGSGLFNWGSVPTSITADTWSWGE